MLSEPQQDGHLLVYPPAKPIGRAKRLLHVNGVTSSAERQLQDLETLVWLTLDRPLDIIGIHNSTSGYRGDLLESMMGKAELAQFWPERLSTDSDKRLQKYADMLTLLCDLTLPPEADILAELQQQRQNLAITLGEAAQKLPFDLEIMRRLPFIQNMNWDDFEAYLYGSYPAGAPRSIFRLAYEVVHSIRTGSEVIILAHSQGSIIAAQALHILQRFFQPYTKWIDALHCIFYGPAVMVDDLPPLLRPQTVLIQHRQDLVAEAFSNLRHVDLWTNLQNQVKSLMERADSIFELGQDDSFHSARHYLGQLETPDSKQAAQLLQRLLIEDWKTNPVLKALGSTRIILESQPL
ncbi:hypothetical protein [Acaryochloris sp. CCMEE 5410]|uniref:hypothetical protein n=1 Tax=Acaryochloris sp. CCMEE 5410 TaxID=310037 RepID=UPI0002484079|nr:hypothetical protein [Acaryochloris sp. CCMEE 5410]KAI9135228.1 hypothetical protein ON05_019620 [Acaryochloris sp. CCMEE 5410]